MTGASILVEHVGKSYGGEKALIDISFSVLKGEVFGLIGPDGAGKTTLFRILASLLLPNTGRASVEGFDTVKQYRELRRIVGYMPGKFSLYHDLTVEENLKFFATIFGTSIKEQYHLVRDIYGALEPFRDRPAGKLSGGMKQKLALSCALIHKPRVLLLDEPTTGVDAVSRVEFWEMLHRLKAEGITILGSTPYMDEAGKCDRVGLIQQGHILDISRPSEITGRYPYRLYAVKSDNMYGLAHDLRQLPSARFVFRFGDSVHVSFPEAIDRQEVSDLLRRKGHDKVEILDTQPAVEDSFMILMGDDGK